MLKNIHICTQIPATPQRDCFLDALKKRLAPKGITVNVSTAIPPVDQPVIDLSERDTLPGSFVISPHSNQRVSVWQCQAWLPLLEEIDRQVDSFQNGGSLPLWNRIRIIPKADRMGIYFKGDKDDLQTLMEDTPYLLSTGFHWLVYPPEIGEVFFEDEVVPWQIKTRENLSKFKEQGWKTAVALSVYLDIRSGLDSHSSPATRRPQLTPLCLSDPRGRRKLLHRFECILKNLPELNALVFLFPEKEQICSCSDCRSTDWIESWAYCLRAFHAIMARYTPEIEMWVDVPEYAFEWMEERTSQIPPGIIAISQSEKQPDFLEQYPTAGLYLALEPGFPGLLDLNQYHPLAEELEQEEIRPFLGMIYPPPGNRPLAFDCMEFHSMAFELDSDDDVHAWYYQKLIAEPEKSNWREWRWRNEKIQAILSGQETHDPDEVLEMFGFQTKDIVPDSNLENCIDQFYQFFANQLKQHPKKGILEKSIYHHLGEWLACTIYKELIRKLLLIPTGLILNGFQKDLMALIREELMILTLQKGWGQFLQNHQRQTILSLIDHLTLYLTGTASHHVWKVDFIPCSLD